MQRILSVEQLTKNFGGIQALSGIDLHVDEGEILGLIGPNGAGKTALINTITGFYKADGGRIELMGRSLIGQPLHQIGRWGVGRTFQNIRLFKRMSVLENVMVAHKAYAAHPFKAFLGFGQRAAAVDQAMHWLTTMHLTHLADRPAQSLSYGDARRLEIARALAGKPDLLLLDEPAAGMNESETESLVTDIHTARTLVKGMLLIEHDMGLIRNLCNRVVAMDYGRKIAQGTASEVLDHPEVKRAYLGDAT